MKQQTVSRISGKTRSNRRVVQRTKAPVGVALKNAGYSLGMRLRNVPGYMKNVVLKSNFHAGTRALGWHTYRMFIRVGELIRRLHLRKTFRRWMVVWGRVCRVHIWPRVAPVGRHLVDWLQRLVAPQNRRAIKCALACAMGRIGRFVFRPSSAQWIALLKKSAGLCQPLRLLNPSVVRVEEPRRFVFHSRLISAAMAIVGLALLAGGISAVTGAAKPVPGENFATAEEAIVSNTETPLLPAVSSSNSSTDSSAAPRSGDGSGNGTVASRARSARFFDPFYVFTQSAAHRVDVYPLSNPPGIVVDLHGMEAPAESAEEMVGMDERIVQVRRIVTSSGLRYIIRTSEPFKKIQSSVEGNVVSVSPLS